MSCIFTGNPGWRLEMNGWRDGFAKEIRFESEGKTYFVIKLRKTGNLPGQS
jgi:hypothetical protein